MPTTGRGRRCSFLSCTEASCGSKPLPPPFFDAPPLARSRSPEVERALSANPFKRTRQDIVAASGSWRPHGLASHGERDAWRTAHRINAREQMADMTVRTGQAQEHRSRTLTDHRCASPPPRHLSARRLNIEGDRGHGDEGRESEASDGRGSVQHCSQDHRCRRSGQVGER